MFILRMMLEGKIPTKRKMNDVFTKPVADKFNEDVRLYETTKPKLTFEIKTEILFSLIEHTFEQWDYVKEAKQSKILRAKIENLRRR